MTTFFTVLFLLVAAHFVADFPLQTDAMATGKNKYLDPAKFGVNWQYWLASHAFTQGLLVAIITQNLWLGVAEVIFHALVDWCKCAKLIDIHTDQALHGISKVVWALIYYYCC